MVKATTHGSGARPGRVDRAERDAAEHEYERPVACSILYLALLGACGGPEAPLPGCTDPARGPAMDRFVDATAASGLDFAYASPDFRGGGLAVGDFDGDGLVDLVVGRRTGGLAMFVNRGGLRFAEMDSGLDTSAPVTAITGVDLDNDGDLDLVIAGGGVTRVMANRGDGSFDEVARFEATGTTEQILAVDLDGDGLLDLYLCNRDLDDVASTQNRLYLNRGNLVFAFAGTFGGGLSWAATAFDVDGDGDQDLYVANDTLLADFGRPMPPTALPTDLLLRNDGLGPDGVPRFTDLAATMGLDEPHSSMGGVLGDFDGDGQLDLYVPNLGAKKLYLRDGAAFDERAASFGLEAIGRLDRECVAGTTHEDCLFLSWSAILTDFDEDGYDELLVANGTSGGVTPPLVMFARGAELPYHEVTPDLACMDAHAMVATDLDGDGDQDLVIAQRAGPITIYENRGAPAPGSWLRVRLHGQTSNRDGIGAVVTVRLASGRTQLRVVGAGGVVHSSTPPEAFFGLAGDEVLTLDVAWPTGRRTEVTHPHPGRLLVEESP